MEFLWDFRGTTQVKALARDIGLCFFWPSFQLVTISPKFESAERCVEVGWFCHFSAWQIMVKKNEKRCSSN